MVVLGRVIAPFGLQGWLKVLPMGDDPAAWGEMPTWWLGTNPADSDPNPGDWVPYVPEGFKLNGKALVVKLKGVDDRTAAERLDGLLLAAPRDALPATGYGEYYWADLIGLGVVNLLAEPLGKVAELIATGANDVLVVRDGETERLLPFIAQVVKDVDLAGGVIRVDWQSDW